MFFSFFFESIITFIQHGYIQIIKRDSKDKNFYISLLIIPCIIYYVTNKETLNLEHGTALCLDRPGAYVRILFVDFSSAFNTIIPNLLLPKLDQLSVPTSICQWITSFLTDRQQLMRLGKYTSSTCMISTGAPES